jgi:hypothetical protein
MGPTEAVERIAALAQEVLGLREAVYPAKGTPPKYPGMVLMLGETSIVYAFGTEQEWHLQVRGLLMTGLTNDTRHHVNEVDPLLVKLVDAFAPNANGGGNFSLWTPGGDHADTCVLGTINAGQEIGYAGLIHYGAELVWDVVFRRFTGDE